jgi:hypothetical protein
MMIDPITTLKMAAKQILTFEESRAAGALFIPRNNPTRADAAAEKPTGNMKKKVLIVWYIDIAPSA